MPELLAQRPKDVSKLIEVVSSQLNINSALEANSETDGALTRSADVSADSKDGAHLKSGEALKPKSTLPQLYLLKLLSEMDVRTLSLTREVRKHRKEFN